MKSILEHNSQHLYDSQLLETYKIFQGLKNRSRGSLVDTRFILPANVARISILLKEIPFVIPFHHRVLLFQKLVKNEKLSQQTDMPWESSQLMAHSGVPQTIRL